MLSIGSVLIARCLYDAVGEREETMIMWSVEGDGMKRL